MPIDDSNDAIILYQGSEELANKGQIEQASHVSGYLSTFHHWKGYRSERSVGVVGS